MPTIFETKYVKFVPGWLRNHHTNYVAWCITIPFQFSFFDKKQNSRYIIFSDQRYSRGKPPTAYQLPSYLISIQRTTPPFGILS